MEDANLIAKKIFNVNTANSVYITADIFKNEESVVNTIKSGYSDIVSIIEGVFDGTSSKHQAVNTIGLGLNDSDGILLDINGDLNGNIPAFLLQQILSDTTSFTD